MAIPSMLQGNTGSIGSTIEPQDLSPPQEKTPGQIYQGLTEEETMLKGKFPAPPSGGKARGPSPEVQQRVQAVREKYEPMLSQPYETFQPSKETASNFAGLGGLLMVMGAMSGSKGLVGATGAMNAMAGMLQGYQQGRQELYEKERKAFETNFKVVQQNRAMLKQEFDRALKEAQTDLQGATTRLSRRLKAAGASALAADVEKNGINTAANAVNQAGQNFDNQIKTYQDAQRRLAQIAAEKKRLDDAAKAQRKAAYIDRAAGVTQQRTAAQRENWYEVDGQPRRLTRAEADQMRTQGITVKDIPTPSSAKPREQRERSVSVIDPNDPKKAILVPESEVIQAAKEGKPFIPAPRTGASGPGGAIQFRYNNAVANATEVAAVELENLASSPIGARPPAVDEVLTNPSKGLTEAGRSFFAQKVTPVEDRAFQQSMAGLTRAVANIQAAGRPGGVTESALRELSKMAPRAGDAKVNTFLFLAMMKQEFGIAVKDLKAAGATPEQIGLAEANKKRIEELIPWTVQDVNRIIRQGGPSLVSEKTIQMLNTSKTIKDFETRIQPPKGGAAGGRVATQADVKATADANFGGDIEMTKRALRARGFTIEGE